MDGATKHVDESTLAQALARREEWAFAQAYQRYGGLMHAAALMVLPRAEDAEDCVHDVLFRIWRHPIAFDAQRGTLRAFLMACVRNEAISRHRAAARRARLAKRIASQREPSEELTLDDFLEKRRLQNAIAQLPQKQREPLLLAFFGGRTHTEVSSELHQPLGTTKSRISLALRKLGLALSTKTDA